MSLITNQIGTVLGPLTTIFTQPETCSNLIEACSTCNVAWQGQICDPNASNGFPMKDNTACWPPATSKVTSPTAPFQGWGFYSPGLECPTGYTAACTAEFNKRPGWPIQFNLVQGETAIGCCPQNYGCTNFFGNTCTLIASASSKVVAQTATCAEFTMTNQALATFPDAIARTELLRPNETSPPTATNVITELRKITLFAPMFQLNYQATDVPGYIPTTAAAQATGADAGGASGMSDGARTGVIIAAVIGGLIVAGLFAWLVLRRRRRGHELPQAAEAWGGSASPRQQQAPPRKSRMSGYNVGWLTQAPVEMDTNSSTPVELPTYVDESNMKYGFQADHKTAMMMDASPSYRPPLAEAPSHRSTMSDAPSYRPPGEAPSDRSTMLDAPSRGSTMLDSPTYRHPPGDSASYRSTVSTVADSPSQRSPMAVSPYI